MLCPLHGGVPLVPDHVSRVQVVITELLGVSLPPNAGLHADDIAHRIVGWLRLVELGPTAAIGESCRSQAYPGIVAGGVAVDAIAQAHRRNLTCRSCQTTIGQVRCKRGRSTCRGCQARQPACGGITRGYGFPRRIGLRQELSGIIIRPLQLGSWFH